MNFRWRRIRQPWTLVDSGGHEWRYFVNSWPSTGRWRIKDLSERPSSLTQWTTVAKDEHTGLKPVCAPKIAGAGVLPCQGAAMAATTATSCARARTAV